MEFFDLFKGTNINSEIEVFNNTPNAILLDVRNEDEFKRGHIPKSKNLPLSKIDKIAKIVSDKNTPLFVYCQSGGRSRNAVSFLERNGYTNVKNIGGIMSYQGKVDK